MNNIQALIHYLSFCNPGPVLKEIAKTELRRQTFADVFKVDPKYEPRKKRIRTYSENIRRGSRHYNAILKDDDIVTMFKMRKEGILQNKIASKFRISENAVSCILLRKRWKHVKIDL